MKKGIALCFVLLSLITFFAFKVSYDVNYTLLKTIDSVEIRKYPKSLYASYYTKGADNNSQFRVLANFIFGGNERQEQIGMTSPVNMKMSSKNNEMMFLMPNRYNEHNLPKPNNNDIEIVSISERTVATIRFSGYANPRKTQSKKAELIQTLQKYGISYTNEFELLVYDSPYKLLNRRNEVLVVLP